jgi:hypothetical protein
VLHPLQSPMARSSFADPRKTAEDVRCGGGRELCGLFCKPTENAIFAMAVEKRNTRDVAAGSIESLRAGTARYLEGVVPLRVVSVIAVFSDVSFGEVLSLMPTRDGRRIARGSKSEENRSTNSVTLQLDGIVVARGWVSKITDTGCK